MFKQVALGTVDFASGETYGSKSSESALGVLGEEGSKLVHSPFGLGYIQQCIGDRDSSLSKPIYDPSKLPGYLKKIIFRCPLL